MEPLLLMTAILTENSRAVDDDGREYTKTLDKFGCKRRFERFKESRTSREHEIDLNDALMVVDFISTSIALHVGCFCLSGGSDSAWRLHGSKLFNQRLPRLTNRFVVGALVASLNYQVSGLWKCHFRFGLLTKVPGGLKFIDALANPRRILGMSK